VRQERELRPAAAEERARRLLDEVAAELAAIPQPLATYRLQLHKAFGFRDAEHAHGAAVGDEQRGEDQREEYRVTPACIWHQRGESAILPAT